MNIGGDFGYHSTKAMGLNGQKVLFNSITGTPNKSRFSLNGADNGIIITQPNHVMVGGAVEVHSRFIQRREDRGWIDSDEYLSLLHAALTELTTASQVEVNIITGLPVDYYEQDRHLLRERLSGQHRVTRDGRTTQVFKINQCKVIPQPFGSLLAETLDDRGRVKDNGLAAGMVGVIDLGSKTTNLQAIRALQELSRESASINAGAWNAARMVRQHLATLCPDLELKDLEVMQAMMDRQVSYYGEKVVLTDAVEAALEPLTEQISTKARELWGKAAALQAILITGGGALLMGERLKRHFKHARVVDDPVFANVRGYWRLAQRDAIWS
jgi:plasmid segregation protein ParM